MVVSAAMNGAFQSNLHKTHPRQFSNNFMKEYIWWTHNRKVLTIAWQIWEQNIDLDNGLIFRELDLIFNGNFLWALLVRVNLQDYKKNGF